jgi:hypothetical protein
VQALQEKLLCFNRNAHLFSKKKKDHSPARSFSEFGRHSKAGGKDSPRELKDGCETISVYCIAGEARS